MGRLRLGEDDKKVSLKISVKKKYVDELKSRGINISRLFEEFVKKYLKIDQ